MSAVSNEIPDRVTRRTTELANDARFAVAARTDRVFAGLLVCQWLTAVGLAIWVTPRTWAGAADHTHPHVWLAVCLGFAIVSLPVWFATFRSGQVLTRHVVAVGQMFSSALLIHLTGGRLETHFHVFGSLAFLSFYRDWRVLMTATVATAADHIVRGLVWPESIYGTPAGVDWRWLEHAGWVVFIDLFLVYSCIRGDQDIRATALREAELEEARMGVEEQVRNRTKQLHENQVFTQGVLNSLEAHIAVLDPTGMRSPGKSILMLEPTKAMRRVDNEPQFGSLPLSRIKVHQGGRVIQRSDVNMEGGARLCRQAWTQDSR